MGVVYAAFDDRLERPIAVKTLRAAGADGALRARLEREARIAARVNHPAVCQLYELGEDDGEQFIAMELLEGESLGSRLARGALPVAEAIGIALGVLAGLEAAHRLGLVHRDVKPSNIFLTPHGAKLLDFGVAATITPLDVAATKLTQPGSVLGTPLYAAPEQLRGEAVDARSDLFSTAVVLYEMLAGQPPFAGSNVMDLFHAVVYEQPAMLGGAASAVNRVLRRALAKRPEERYPSADAMAHDLRATLPMSDTGMSVTVRAMTRLIVLPFRVLRTDPDTDFLAFSLADAITNGLTGLQSLVVRSSAAALRFGPEADLKAVGADAEVDAVLLGTLFRAGEQLRVSAQLVEVPASTVLWSQTIQVPIGDLFGVQDQITNQLVKALAIPLTAHERSMLTKDVPASARAYDLYLRANEMGRDTRQWRAALELYEQAVVEDPHYAPAWAGIGRLHRMLGKYVDDNVAERFAKRGERVEASAGAQSGSVGCREHLRVSRSGSRSIRSGHGASRATGARAAGGSRPLRRPLTRQPLLWPPAGVHCRRRTGPPSRSRRPDQRRAHVLHARRLRENAGAGGRTVHQRHCARGARSDAGGHRDDGAARRVRPDAPGQLHAGAGRVAAR